ncbi:MAG: dephospho-CoA kinase [Bacteroidales bacterium]|nr:dephospho-CoA kinase [Bacteroidales bacterium]
MLYVGLTGGIGSGKTTVAEEFERLGIPCFVADKAGADYYEDLQFCQQVAAIVGPHVLKPDGHVSKRAIADTIFADPVKLQALNALVHPRVLHDFRQWAARQTAPYILFECAILFEYHLEDRMDAVIAVYTSLQERLQRLQLRDHATVAQLQPFVEAQMAAEEKMRRADYVVLNYEGNPRARQVCHIHQQLLAKAAALNDHADRL